MDHGYEIIIKAAADLGKGEKGIEAADEEYSRMMKAQDRTTQKSPVFQQIAALAAIETHLKPHAFGQ